jgi:hypothetical protein
LDVSLPLCHCSILTYPYLLSNLENIYKHISCLHMKCTYQGRNWLSSLSQNYFLIWYTVLTNDITHICTGTSHFKSNILGMWGYALSMDEKFTDSMHTVTNLFFSFFTSLNMKLLQVILWLC